MADTPIEKFNSHPKGLKHDNIAPAYFGAVKTGRSMSLSAIPKENWDAIFGPKVTDEGCGG